MVAGAGVAGGAVVVGGGVNGCERGETPDEDAWKSTLDLSYLAAMSQAVDERLAIPRNAIGMVRESVIGLSQ